VCFAIMKAVWKEEIQKFEELNRRKVGKGDFTEVFGKAFIRAFKKETVEAAFRVTGIHPFDHTVITARQMKPSEPTSTKGAFPLMQPSPVRAIMASYHHHTPTTFDLDPETHAAVGGSVSPSRRVRDPTIDPDLYTPSKRMRMMTSAVAGTSSGSFLVSSIQITSQHTISAPVLEGPPSLPDPEWSLLDQNLDKMSRSELVSLATSLQGGLGLARQHIAARDGIIEGAHATMVIQNMFVERQSQALNAKENKKSKDRTKILMDGKGRHLTDREFISKLEKAQQERNDEARAKEKRAGVRNAARVARLALEVKWKEVQEVHRRQVEAWETECQKLADEGVPKKHLPKRPLRPPKPKLTVAVEATGDREDDETGSDDSDEG
jgi:hypothetical protein